MATAIRALAPAGAAFEPPWSRWLRRLVGADPFDLHPDPQLLVRLGRVRRANRAAAALFGVSGPRALVGRSSEGLVSGAPGEHRIQSLDGRVLQVELRVVPAGEDQLWALREIDPEILSLRAREQLYSALFTAQAPFAVATRPDGRVVDMSRVARSLLGPDEVAVGVPIWAVRAWRAFYPESPEGWRRRVARARVNGADVSEERFVLGEGFGTAEVVTTAITGPEGAVDWYLVQAIDVSERCASSVALARSEARLSATLDAAQIVAWEIDVESGEIWEAGPVAEMFGRAPGFRHADAAEFYKDVHPDDRGMVSGDFGAIRRSAARYSMEFRVTTPEGEVRWVQSMGRLEVDQDGRPHRLLGIASDVTQRVMVARALEASQAQYRAVVEQHQARLEEEVAARTAELAAAEAQARLILESSADGLFGVDAEGRVSFVNPAACEILGLRAEQLVGFRPEEVFRLGDADGSELPAEQRPVRRALDAGVSAALERATCWRPDGVAVPVAWAARPMLREGRIVGAVASFRDVSALRAAELAREAALEEARRLAAARSEFLANMSHEIRTPLAAVLGTAQVGLRGDVPRREKDLFLRIVDAGQHLGAVVDDILDFSKIEAGHLVTESIPWSPGRVVDHAVDLLAQRAVAKGLELVVDEAPDLPASCIGDPLRVGQALLNLVSNAVKFTPAGRVRVSAAVVGGELHFVVEDTGIGMTPEEIERAFNPFVQGDGSTTRRFGGTGLGLAISRRLVLAMGGRIGVSSRPGRGSRFEIHLPLREPVAAEAARGRVALVGLADGAALALALRARGVEAVLHGNLGVADPDPIDAELVLCDATAVLHEPAVRALIERCRPGARFVVAESPGGPRWAATAFPSLPARIDRPLRARHVLALLAAVPAGHPVATGPRLSGVRILVAEDNEANRFVLEETLRAEGAVVTCTGDGGRALDSLADLGPAAFDLVITDVQMPVMDGYETARRVRQLDPGLPVVGLTAHAMAEERARCLAAGMVEHLAKPVEVEPLVATVRRWARVQAPLPPEPRPARAGTVSWERVEAQYGGRRAFVDKLVRTILGSLGDSVGALRRALDAGEAAEIAVLAHRLRGTAGTLVMPELAELARRVELGAREDRPDLRHMGENLARESGLLVEDLKRRLGGPDRLPEETPPTCPGPTS